MSFFKCKCPLAFCRGHYFYDTPVTMSFWCIVVLTDNTATLLPVVRAKQSEYPWTITDLLCYLWIWQVLIDRLWEYINTNPVQLIFTIATHFSYLSSTDIKAIYHGVDLTLLSYSYLYYITCCLATRLIRPSKWVTNMWSISEFCCIFCKCSDHLNKNLRQIYSSGNCSSQTSCCLSYVIHIKYSEQM